MIQISATLPAAAAAKNPLMALSADASAEDFVAMLTTALAQAGDGDGNPMLAALAGTKAQALTGAVGVDGAAASGQEADDASPVAVPGTEQAADPALLVLLGLSMPAPAAEALAQATPGEPGTDAEAAPATDVTGRALGKKLPNPMAVIAAQQKVDKTGADEAMVVQPAATATSTSEVPTVAAESTAALTAVAELKESPAAKSASASATNATPAVAGQEAALGALRNQVAPAAADKVVLNMQNGLGSSAWQQELGDKLIWTANRNGQTAELVLNPPALGTVEVRLNLSGGDASAQFFAANPHVREALEAAMPRLRELMGSAGIILGQAMVSDQSLGQRDRAEQGTDQRSGDASTLLGAVAEGDGVVRVRTAGSSLLDYFA